MTHTCELFFKLLRKNVPVGWNKDCQRAFEKIKEYMLTPSILITPVHDRSLIMYLVVMDNSIGCLLGQHGEDGHMERAIHYLSKKFLTYEINYSLLEKTCCALAWVAHRLRHYMLYQTTYLISLMDPLKYIFEKPMLSSRLSRWHMLLAEFDIIFTT